jgi:hypothetical protein
MLIYCSIYTAHSISDQVRDSIIPAAAITKPHFRGISSRYNIQVIAQQLRPCASLPAELENAQKPAPGTAANKSIRWCYLGV